MSTRVRRTAALLAIALTISTRAAHAEWIRDAGSMSVVSTEGTISEFTQDRARPNAAAVAGNFSNDGKDVGGIAILSDARNIAERAPWYIINAPHDMRFICAAVLAPAVRTIPPGGEWTLRYRVVARPTAWTSDALSRATTEWRRAN